MSLNKLKIIKTNVLDSHLTGINQIYFFIVTRKQLDIIIMLCSTKAFLFELHYKIKIFIKR